MPRLEVAQHEFELRMGRGAVHGEHRVDDAAYPPGPSVDRVRLDRDMEGPHHHARGIGLQPKGTMDYLEHAAITPIPRGCCYEAAFSFGRPNPLSICRSSRAIAQQAN